MTELWDAQMDPGGKDDPAGAVLGQGLPLEAEVCLWAAAENYGDSEVAEAHLRKAEEIAPDHAAVLIGFYRFYFYKGRLPEALQIAIRCLQKAARENNLHPDWRQVRATDAVFDRYEEVLPRFYLFTLKGYAYLQMRLGEIDESRDAIAKLLELDPSDKVGANVLLGVLDRIGEDDEG